MLCPRFWKLSALRPITSTFSVLFFALCAGIFVPAASATTLVIQGLAGTRVSIEEAVPGGENATGTMPTRALGTIGADGLLVISENVPAGAQTLIFEHADALEPLKTPVSVAGTSLVLKPELKLRPGSLTVICQPADLEIFIDGVHRGRGALMLGNVPAGKELLVEVRSSRLGEQAKRVVPVSGKNETLSFDLRGNTPKETPDGKIVLPDVPLALASQPGAILRLGGVPVSLKDGALTELAPGQHVLEIFFMLGERQISVWKGALLARSVIFPAANAPAPVMAAPNSAENAPAGTEQPVAETAGMDSNTISGTVTMVAGTRFSISVGAHAGLADGGTYLFKFSKQPQPVLVRLSGVSGNSAAARILPSDTSEASGTLMPEEGDSFTVKLLPASI